MANYYWDWQKCTLDFDDGNGEVQMDAFEYMDKLVELGECPTNPEQLSDWPVWKTTVFDPAIEELISSGKLVRTDTTADGITSWRDTFIDYESPESIFYPDEAIMNECILLMKNDSRTVTWRPANRETGPGVE
jgi:hypothetical protein